MQVKLLYIIFSALYIFFILFFLDILIIPTYEFITLPFLRFTNPNYHLNSFKYISGNKDNGEKLENKDGNRVNKSLSFFGFFFYKFVFQ